jgi:hypothetical protein
LAGAVSLDGSCNSCKSAKAEPLDPPNTYMLVPCTTLVCESRGMGGVPSVTRADQVRDSKSNMCVSDKCRVPSWPPYKMIMFRCMTQVARYRARGRRPAATTAVHLDKLKSNSCKSDLFERKSRREQTCEHKSCCWKEAERFARLTCMNHHTLSGRNAQHQIVRGCIKVHFSVYTNPTYHQTHTCSSHVLPQHANVVGMGADLVTQSLLSTSWTKSQRHESLTHEMFHQIRHEQ